MCNILLPPKNSFCDGVKSVGCPSCTCARVLITFRQYFDESMLFSFNFYAFELM